jgi:hypothetical protein
MMEEAGIDPIISTYALWLETRPLPTTQEKGQ